MYAFPNITIPTAAVSAAALQNMKADEYYCIDLVEKTGIVCVPGSGFGQKNGTSVGHAFSATCTSMSSTCLPAAVQVGNGFEILLQMKFQAQNTTSCAQPY